MALPDPRVKLSISIDVSYNSHEELVKAIEKSTREVLVIARREKGLAMVREPQPAPFYLDLLSDGQTRRIVFSNPIQE